MTKKRAVDSSAEQYWTEYFGDYGKAWVRKMPRRVAHAVARRIASTDPKAPAFKAAVIAPLGHAKLEDGGLLFEGIFRGMTPDAGQQHRTFAAEFAPDGSIRRLEVV